MKIRKNVMTMVLLLSLGSILSLSIIENNAFAQTGMSLEATSERGSSTILLSGQTTKSGDISIIVTAPNENVISIAQVTPDFNGEYELVINTGGSLWKQNGNYEISAQQGNLSMYKLNVTVEIIDGKVQTTKASESSLVDTDLQVIPTEAERGLSFFADVIPGSKTIPISGHTSSLLLDITITVTAPNGNIISVDQVRPDINGNFETEIHTGSNLWMQDGFYTISIQQGESSQFKDTAQVEIIDGAVIPEFGTIAALVLAVAIVSIIAVSARSRLSIMPKF